MLSGLKGKCVVVTGASRAAGYGIAKAVLEAASQATAIDFAPHGVRVNVAALGMTENSAHCLVT